MLLPFRSALQAPQGMITKTQRFCAAAESRMYHYLHDRIYNQSARVNSIQPHIATKSALGFYFWK